MTDELIELLNLSNINVDKELSFVCHGDEELQINIFLKRQSLLCPNCGSTDCICHGYRMKRIVHSISTMEKCNIKLHLKRYICKDCKHTFLERQPFSDRNAKISNTTLSMILDDLRSHTVTFSNVALKYNVSITSIMRKFDKYVNCSRLVLPEVLCMDEIYTKKLTKKKYCCVMLDFKTKQLVDVLPSRHKFDLEKYFCSIPQQESKNVKYVVMDMWEPYKEVAKNCLFNPIIAVDSFHVIKHLNDAIDKIRLSIMKKFERGKSKLEDAHTYHFMLKKFHYFFTKNYDRIYDGEIRVGKLGKWTKDAIRKYLLEIDADLAEAYWLKQRYQEFNLTTRYESCDNELNKFIKEFKKSKFASFREFGKLLDHWKEEIKNSFITIDNRRLSNGAMEGVNSRLKCLIKISNGYTNFGRFRNRCLFSINSNTPLKVYPKNTKK